jgi:hypothetical protein
MPIITLDKDYTFGGKHYLAGAQDVPDDFVKAFEAKRRREGSGQAQTPQVIVQPKDPGASDDDASQNISTGGTDDRDALPADFPGRAELLAANIDKLSTLRTMDEKQLVAVKDIGPSLAAQIVEARNKIFGEGK